MITTLDYLTDMIANTEDLLAILCILQEKCIKLDNKNINKICNTVSPLIEASRVELEDIEL